MTSATTIPAATTGDSEAAVLPFTAKTRTRIGLALFTLLAYVPLLLTDVGKVAADSKSYFYLDPGRLLSSAASMWDPTISMGTVSYQTLGYLFPIGPMYWLLEEVLRVPPWIAERFWLGSLLLAAGLGTRYLLRTLGVRGAGIAVGMLAYAFTPYVIQFSSRTSVLLGPWAATPWMAALVILGLRRGGWKYPALLAITVQLSGSVNAATLGFALLAPLLFIVFAVFIVRETEWRRAWSVVWRSGLLIFVTSLWWMSARWPSPPGTAATCCASPRRADDGVDHLSDRSPTRRRVLVLLRQGRGLVVGAGRDELHAQPQRRIREHVVARARAARRRRGALALPALLRAARARGLLHSPSARARTTTRRRSARCSRCSRRATRSGSRSATPDARCRSSRSASRACSQSASARSNARLAERNQILSGVVVAFVIGALCLVNAPGVWGGTYYSNYAEWHSIPEYWKQAANSLDTAHNTRVLVLPGSPFATYTWGSVIDPVLPGLISRPTVTRDQIPYGSEATANLLQAVDGRLENNVLDPNALAPVARLMGVGDLLLDMDFQTDRYGLIPSDLLWQTFTERQPTGLGAPTAYGTKIPGTPIPNPGDVARLPIASPPPLAVFAVKNPLSIVRTKSADDPIIIDGDGEGLVDVASVGLLDARRLVVYSPTYEKDPEKLRKLAANGTLIVTDSNRKRPHATTLINNYGPTEQANEDPLVKTPYDQRLEEFPDETSKSQTVTLLNGVKSVRATFGNQAFGVARRRSRIDGDPKTTWATDAAVPVGNQRLEIKLDKPITTDHIRFFQPVKAAQGRWITDVTMQFDGHGTVHGKLDDESRSKTGQSVTFPKRKFSTVVIRINHVHHTEGGPQNPIGFVEVRMSDEKPGAPRVRASERTRLPLDLLETMGTSSLDHELVLSLSRDQMDNANMRRVFTLPTAVPSPSPGPPSSAHSRATPTSTAGSGCPTRPRAASHRCRSRTSAIRWPARRPRSTAIRPPRGTRRSARAAATCSSSWPSR